MATTIGTRVTGTTERTPTGPYWYWTQLGPQNVNLDGRTVNLPPGSYDLFWDFRGKPGDTLQLKLTDANGNDIVTLTDSIAVNDSESWGQKSFKVA